MGADEQAHQEPSGNPPDATASPTPLQYFTPTSPRLVTLRRFSSLEAQLAKARLESEGILCFIANEHSASVVPALAIDTELLVHENDAEEAERVLSRPASPDAEGEYTEEDFRCPKCHRKSTELVPLSRGWQWVRMTLILMILVAMLTPVLSWVLGPSSSSKVVLNWMSDVGMMAVVAAIALGLSLILAKRRVRCRECGQEWRKGD
jgi:hypothetical protein